EPRLPHGRAPLRGPRRRLWRLPGLEPGALPEVVGPDGAAGALAVGPGPGLRRPLLYDLLETVRLDEPADHADDDGLRGGTALQEVGRSLRGSDRLLFRSALLPATAGALSPPGQRPVRRDPGRRHDVFPLLDRAEAARDPAHRGAGPLA